MEFVDFKKEYGNMKSEISKAVQGVLNSGSFIGGEEVDKFENEVANYCETKHAISVNSGTDALFLSLEAIDVRGKEVITTPFTFIATVGTILRAGGIPVFVDINEDDFNINSDRIEAKITSRTKVILPVHLFGKPCRMGKIMRLAKQYDLMVVEDAAQAFGAINYDSKKIGSVGHVGCFSFYPTKNLGGMGDGGIIVTDSNDLNSKIRMLKNHGISPGSRYDSVMIGTNSRLDAIQAAILRVKLRYLDEQIKERKENAEYYSVALNQKYFEDSTYNQYTIRIKDRNKFDLDFLHQIYYPKPLHLSKALEYLGHREGDFPIAERASEEVVSIPLLVSKEDQDYIINKIKKYV